jgi:hypothetical protein
MKTKTAKMLPKTGSEIRNGGLYLQHVRCGKQNCKCARGDVRKKDVEAFLEIVNVANIERAKRREVARSSNKLLKHLRETLRDCEQSAKLYKQNYNYEQNKT